MKPNLDKLLSKVQKGGGDDDCWIWVSHKTPNGYGRVPFNENGKSKSGIAHKMIFEAVNGPVPDGLQLDHLCRTRDCVNPAHLEIVTARENTIRGVGPTALNAAKTHCKRGHPLIPENLTPRSYKRECKLCEQERMRRKYAAKLAKRAAIRDAASPMEDE